MSMAQLEHAPDAHGADAHGHHHDPAEHLAHHFDDKHQQFDSGKLGIWVFLVTEILFFSGLFCAYAVYRSHHPEIFSKASHFLNTTLGATNTIVLLFSSLTAAWAVRNAQLGQKRALMINIVLTILCACGFMVIKYFEYTHKIHMGVVPGANYHPSEEAQKILDGLVDEHGNPIPQETSIQEAWTWNPDKPEAKNVQIFFSIYYGMTGLHGFHVLCGIVVWLWILRRASRGEFGPKFFGPVDFTALYWHIVDVIWIFLFPLLYLIH